jgi:predicted DNA-binding transcriptional regulator YafY
VVAWILGFGPDVRVVEPKALRRRIASLAQQMAKVHRER